MMKRLIYVFVLFTIFNSLYSQTEVDYKESSVYFDAVSFQSDKDSLSRIDYFLIIPYSNLNFKKSGSEFLADFIVNIKLTDSAEHRIESKKFKRVIKTDEYFKAQGGYGDYDYINGSFEVISGNYKAEAEILDNNSGTSIVQKRNISVLNYRDYPFSISGVILLSAIEEKNGEYIITPFFSDNIADLPDGYFSLFEIYNYNNTEKCDFVSIIYNNEMKPVYTSKRKTKEIAIGKSQNYIFNEVPSDLTPGSYILRIFALRTNGNSEFIENDIIAATERTVKIIKTIGGVVLTNIDLAIEQASLAASSSEYSYMKDAKTEKEKYERFEEFWKKLDPSELTDRNEAFEEFYSRIKYANAKFSVSSNGWKSDMGRVYIIYGNPYSVERSQQDSRGRTYEKWTFANNREFYFLDNGFGDFKLYSPSSIMDKYTYRAGQ